jgi:hypothetical protein
LALAVLFALLEIAANTRELVRQRDTGQGGQRWQQ